MFQIYLSGKNALVYGVANHRSIAWSIAKILSDAGARIGLVYQNDRLREPVEQLSSELNDALLFECDVTDDDQLVALHKDISSQMGSLSIVVHSIAFADRNDLGGDFSNTGRDGFRMALEVSAFSLLPVTKYASELMTDGGSIIAMTFLASERVFPGYNVMGTAKAALENSVRQLSAEYGPRNIRINAISAGPVDTLSSRVISGYRDMKKFHEERSPLGRSITLEDVAGTALYLATDLSSGVTGAVLPVDAGYSIMGI